MAFEVFDKRFSPKTKEPFLTVQRKGTIGLNGAAYVELGEPVSVELLYDKDEKTLGLRKVSKDSSHAYLVRLVGGSSRIVSGMALFRYYEIPLKETKRYLAKNYGDGILGIDLKAGTEVPNRLHKNGTKKIATPLPGEWVANEVGAN